MKQISLLLRIKPKKKSRLRRSKTNSTLNPKLDLSWLKLCLVTTHKRLATRMIMNRLLRVRRCSGWQLRLGSMENWRNPRLRVACLQWFSVLVRDLPAAGGNFWRYTYLFEENVYHFRRPNRSYHEEKRCERVGKRCIFSGAPDGAIKSFNPLVCGHFSPRSGEIFLGVFFNWIVIFIWFFITWENL